MRLEAATPKNTPINAGYHAAASAKARHVVVLSTCGKGFMRTDLVEVDFGPAKALVLAGSHRRALCQHRS